MIEQIKKTLKNYIGEWKENNGIFEFQSIIAERKTFLSKQKLIYSAKIKIDENTKVVYFSEMLIESGFGLAFNNNGFDLGMSTGFGFKKEIYNTTKGYRDGTIDEQSTLFGKKYEYKFNYKDIRSKVEETIMSLGYKFEYQIFSLK